MASQMGFRAASQLSRMSQGFMTTSPRIADQLEIDDYSIHYEVHGTGAKNIVFISGLISSFANFKALVDYFANNGFSCLVMDTRGYGLSTGGSSWRYTTSGMAQDVLKVLNEVGWTANSSINVVGMSMGGMIAQELCLVVPERIRSLSL